MVPVQRGVGRSALCALLMSSLRGRRHRGPVAYSATKPNSQRERLPCRRSADAAERMDLPRKCNLDLARANHLAGEKHVGGAPAAERGRGGDGAPYAGLFPTG